MVSLYLSAVYAHLYSYLRKKLNKFHQYHHKMFCFVYLRRRGNSLPYAH